MNGKRLALAVILAGLGLAAIGGVGTSTGQSQDPPGLTYGGTKDVYPAWLRLAPGRSAIAALHMEWAIAPERCSHNKTYSNTLYAGFEERRPIDLRADGTFARTVVDIYRERGTRYEERQVVSGRVVDDIARGSLRGRVKITKPNGRVVRCTFGPQKWRLVD